MPLPENWPVALDSLSDPGPATTTDEAGFELSQVISRLHSLVEKMETRFGTGAANGTPVAGQFYGGTGTGTAGYRKIVAADITAGALPTLLASPVVLVSAQTLIDFQSIPATHNHLELRVTGRSTANVTSELARLRFNNDAGNNYWGQGIYAAGAGTGGLEQAFPSDHVVLGAAPGVSAAAGWSTVMTISIPGYLSSFYKSVTSVAYQNMSPTLGNQNVRVHAGVYGFVTTISRVTLSVATGNWAIGTTVSLYGYP